MHTPARGTRTLATAALALLGAGVAAAVLARRRAAAEQPAQPARAPRRELKSMTLGELHRAIVLLEGHGAQTPAQTVHEARKALKRTRALVRLQRESLGSKRFARANATLRRAGRRLAEARDAEVMVQALDALLKRQRKQLRRSAGVAALRAELLAERDRLYEAIGEGTHARAAIVAELRQTHCALQRSEPEWHEDKHKGKGKRKDKSNGDDKSEHKGKGKGNSDDKSKHKGKGNGDDKSKHKRERQMARRGVRRIYRQGRRRLARAQRARSSATLHDWRKRVKDLRYVAEALELRGGVARRADRLGETIGEEHDLMLLRGHLRRRRAHFQGEQATRRAIEKLIRARRKRLRKRAYKLGEQLYGRKPKRFVRVALKR
jgi:hypothetical protein